MPNQWDDFDSTHAAVHWPFGFLVTECRTYDVQINIPRLRGLYDLGEVDGKRAYVSKGGRYMMKFNRTLVTVGIYGYKIKINNLN